ncbi:MAG: adenylate/guanylate cyclase domain-containing protein [Bacteroidia bacterium]
MAASKIVQQYHFKKALQYGLMFQAFALVFYLAHAVLVSPEKAFSLPFDERFFGAGAFGFVAGLIDEFYLRQNMWKMQFAKALLLKTLAFAFLIAVGAAVFQGIELLLSDKASWIEGNEMRYVRHTFQVFGFFALVSLLSISAIQIGRYVGKGRLMYFLTGKYEHPAWEENILMFVDLKASTTIADSLNSNHYSEFLKDYIEDLSEPIYMFQGNIHQYVGDEIIVYWPTSKSKRANARPLHCFVGMMEVIKERATYYHEKYGVLPEFKGGLHGGQMIVTEVGAMKKEIAFHGTVVNTTSRIQQKCNELNTNFLISDYILTHTELTPMYVPFREGSFLLKGKTEPMELYSVEKAENAWRRGVRS